MAQPLMPKATAVWLIENTVLTFDQIADFCGLHALEVLLQVAARPRLPRRSGRRRGLGLLVARVNAQMISTNRYKNSPWYKNSPLVFDRSEI